MDKPDFIIIGAAKSGTTSLARYLASHPNIKVVGERLEFFGEYSNPRFDDISADEYTSMMCCGSNENYTVGEKSVSYLYSKNAPKEIFKMVPNAKLIVILRNPIERAYSDYWHRVRTGVETLSFKEALDAESGRILAGKRFELHYATYGLYTEYLKNYIDLFGRDRVLILFYEDLKKDSESVTRSCLEFLGVKVSTDGIDFIVHNKGGGNTSLPVRLILLLAQNKKITSFIRSLLPKVITQKIAAFLVRSTSDGKYPKMLPEDKARLINFFEESISELEELTGRDLSSWRSI